MSKHGIRVTISRPRRRGPLFPFPNHMFTNLPVKSRRRNGHSERIGPFALLVPMPGMREYAKYGLPR